MGRVEGLSKSAFAKHFKASLDPVLSMYDSVDLWRPEWYINVRMPCVTKKNRPFSLVFVCLSVQLAHKQEGNESPNDSRRQKKSKTGEAKSRKGKQGGEGNKASKKGKKRDVVDKSILPLL